MTPEILAGRSAAAAIKAIAPGFEPRIGLVLGSGLGGIADAMADRVEISYDRIPGYPEPGVSGHAGRLVLGRLAGLPVACLQGRAHAYEGDRQAMAPAVRSLKLLGAEALFLTCAAGSLRREVGPGRLMLITDHINLSGGSPLVGPNDESIGPRFPPLVDAYDPGLSAIQRRVADTAGIDLAEGVYCQWLGPAFETPAEVRMIKLIGSDAVGMSTVPETLLARHCGLKVTAIAVITNLGVGLAEGPVDHHQTLTAAKAAEADLKRQIEGFAGALAG